MWSCPSLPVAMCWHSSSWSQMVVCPNQVMKMHENHFKVLGSRFLWIWMHSFLLVELVVVNLVVLALFASKNSLGVFCRQRWTYISNPSLLECKKWTSTVHKSYICTSKSFDYSWFEIFFVELEGLKKIKIKIKKLYICWRPSNILVVKI